MNKNCDVTILLATYNGEKYIGEQLESLLCQTYKNFICYIHDDGSQDKTVEILKAYEKNYPDKFKIYDYASQGSAQQNFYSMLWLVETKYAMFCDQDDVWKDDKIEKEREAIIKAEKEEKCEIPILVYTDLEVVDKERNVIENSFYKYMDISPRNVTIKSLLLEGVAAGCTTIINRRMIYLMNTSNHGEIMHDLWASFIAIALGKMIFLSDSTMYYRQHENNVVGAKINKSKTKRSISLTRSYVERLRNMARNLLDILPITHEEYKFIKKFSNISNKSKLYRIYFYWRYNVFNPKSNRIWISMWL